VPSLAAGGLVGIAVGRLISYSEPSVAACAVIGMGSLFASVMHLPVTGVIIMFELTWAKSLIVHVILANFIASNVVHRMPHGSHSFVHCILHNDPVWKKLGGQDFIETDKQENNALSNFGVQRIRKMETGVLKMWLMDERERVRLIFFAWSKQAEATGLQVRRELAVNDAQIKRYLSILSDTVQANSLRSLFAAFVAYYIDSLKRKAKSSAQMLAVQRNEPNMVCSAKQGVDSTAQIELSGSQESLPQQAGRNSHSLDVMSVFTSEAKRSLQSEAVPPEVAALLGSADGTAGVPLPPEPPPPEPPPTLAATTAWTVGCLPQEKAPKEDGDAGRSALLQEEAPRLPAPAPLDAACLVRKYKV
jgi:hypothetical protein